jgi:hypothetical protein
LAARDKTQDTLDELRAGLGLFAFGDNREGIRRSA